MTIYKTNQLKFKQIMNQNNTPFYQDKTFYLTAIAFTIIGYYALPKALDWYQNR